MARIGALSHWILSEALKECFLYHDWKKGAILPLHYVFQDAEIIEAKGKVVMPSFIDTHHHQFETALRSSLVNGMLVDDGTEEGKINYLSYILGKMAPVYQPEGIY